MFISYSTKKPFKKKRTFEEFLHFISNHFGITVEFCSRNKRFVPVNPTNKRIMSCKPACILIYFSFFFFPCVQLTGSMAYPVENPYRKCISGSRVNI